jgi:mRNA interferase HigB
MRVIKVKTLREFWTAHPTAEAPLRYFIKAVRRQNWRNWSELKATCRSADSYRRCVIFDIGGNNFRLIGWVRYSRSLEGGRWSQGRIFVRHVLTHAEYDKDQWKADCT